ncbi:transmembrane protease serine 11E-like isoform X1 [Podarcis lilfordi]|uniref:Transmembrane protease serine 11E-like isoform X1 n=1 Tax=Podarcis lilfordi TaxID=74358 RepID=A0AA35L4H3_9SAUR|nr:transmembrane protease serine 11E-like isoform X1 [Podarcis lilfordi]
MFFGRLWDTSGKICGENLWRKHCCGRGVAVASQSSAERHPSLWRNTDRVRDLRSWTASFGARLNPPLLRRNLRQIIVHEQYAESVMRHEFDIAVVQLAYPVQFTAAVHRICLPEASHIFPENTTCFVTGYGALRDEGPSVGELRQTEVKIIGNEICNRWNVYNGAISAGMLCAGYLEGGSDACQGDSGGPLVTPDSRGIWYLVGIVSWGEECAKPNKPGVYTRLAFPHTAGCCTTDIPMKDLPFTIYPACHTSRCKSSIFQKRSRSVDGLFQTGSGTHLGYENYDLWGLQGKFSFCSQKTNPPGHSCHLMVLPVRWSTFNLIWGSVPLRDQRLTYFSSNFKIMGVQYNPALSRQSSDRFREAGNWIEKLMYETFHNSILRPKYRGSRLVKVSPDTGGVIAQVVLMFLFSSTDNTALRMAVDKILQERLKMYPGSGSNLEGDSEIRIGMRTTTLMTLMTTALPGTVEAVNLGLLVCTDPMAFHS